LLYSVYFGPVYVSHIGYLLISTYHNVNAHTYNVLECDKTVYTLLNVNFEYIADVNPCMEVTCPTLSQCVPNGGSYTCECDPGHRKNADDECVEWIEPPCVSGMPCPQNSECIFDGESNTCACVPGYMKDAKDQCVDETDPCNAMPCPTNSDCIPDGESYTCDCTNGYVYQADTGDCVVYFDACATVACPTNSGCQAGSTECVCHPGYVDMGDGICVGKLLYTSITTEKKHV
jgi:hypothetical protein